MIAPSITIPRPNKTTFVAEKEVPMVLQYPSMQPLCNAAWMNYGVQLAYFYYRSPFPEKEPKPGYYAVISPDQQTLSALQKGVVSLTQVLEDNLKRHPNEFMCYYHSIYLSEINDRNAFRIVRDIEKALKNCSTAKYAFQEYGYDLPKSVQQITIDKFARYNNIRHAKDLSEAVRNEYQGIMKKSVAYANEMYNKDRNYSNVPLVPIKAKDHLVTREYFEKNHIQAHNDVVSEDFWNFLQTKMQEDPYFRIWKDKKPSLVLKDNSSSKGVTGINIWESQKEYKEYNVTFSEASANSFYTWLLEYKTSCLENIVGEKELIEDTDHVVPVQMALEDLKVFDERCAENGGLPFCINHGIFGKNGADQVRKPTIGVRFEDTPVVGKILYDMSYDGTADVVYAVNHWKQLDALPNASYANPYLTEFQKQNNGITR